MPAVQPLTRPSTKPKNTRQTSQLPDEAKPHQCFICGCVYPKQPDFFPKIRTKMYRGNNSYAPVCRTCCTQYYQNWLKAFNGDDKKAIRRCCEWLNVYYDRDLAGTCGDGIVGYLADMDKNCKPFIYRSWDDTLAEEAQIVGSDVNAIMTVGEDRSPVVEEGVEVFGEGFPADAYAEMLHSYHGYIDPLGDTVTAAQVKSARFLAALEYRCMEAIKADKPNASALSSSLTRAIKESGFDTIQTQDSSNEGDTFGVWLAEIEEYTPAEYVKKHPYKDIDNYDRYYDRFVRRSVENLLNRSSQKQDDELSISDEEARSLDVGDSDDAT